MKINFVLSDTTKGATTAALTKVVEMAENDVFGSFIVLVPETKSIIIEKELLSLSKRGSFANVFVYSFVRLLDRIGHLSPEKTLGKQACTLLLRKIIYDNIASLKCYKKTAKTIGFAEKMYETIAQLKSSDISADDLRFSLETSKLSLKAKLEDIILIYEEYEKRLGGEFFDDCDRLAILSVLAKNNEFLANSHIFLVGFDNITFEMQRVIKDLAVNVKEITFSCVYFNENRKDRHIQNNELYLKLAHIADELKYPYVPKVFKSFKKGDFFDVQNYICSTEKKQVKSDGSIKVFEARTKKIELDFVANTILKEVKAGKRFKDIGVLLADMEGDIDVLKECFEAYKIPYFANVPESIDSQPLFRFIKNAFELRLSHLSSENVLKFMGSPLFCAEDFAADVCYANETGVNYSEFLKEIDSKFFEVNSKYFEKLAGLDDEDQNETSIDLSGRADAIRNDFEKFRNFYFKFDEILSSGSKVKDYISAINFIIKYFSVESKIEKIAENQHMFGLETLSRVNETSLLKLEKLNESLSNFLGETETDLSEFLGIFLSGAKSIMVRLAPVSIDCVIVQGDTDGFFDISDLFIVGAIEGKFPSKITDSGIILDSELDEAKSLIQKGIEPSVKDINRRENFKAYEALIEPKEKLYVSFSLKSLSGKNNKPARFVLDLISLFGGEILSRKYERIDFVNFEILERQFVKAINDFENDRGNLTQVNEIYSELGDKISEKLGLFLFGLEQGQHNFNLESTDGLYFFNGKTSVSQIQTYFDCPYKFFAQYGLKLKENRLAKLNLPDIGSIIHKIAEIFGKNIAKFESLSEEEFNQKVRALVFNVFEDMNLSVEKNKALVSILLDESLRLTKYIAYEQKNSGFKMTSQEFVFAGNDAISLDGGKVRLEGKIDRIDEFGDYIRIIDYKTGNVENNLKSIYYGRKIQLSAYLEAVQSKGKKVAGVFYFPVHSDYAVSEEKSKTAYKMVGLILDNIDIVKNMDHSLNGESLKSNIVPIWTKIEENGEMVFNGRQTRYSEEEFEFIKDYVNKLCSQAVSEIAGGYIEPSPIADENGSVPLSCKFCKLSGFCGLEKSRFSLGRELSSKVDILSFDVEEK